MSSEVSTVNQEERASIRSRVPKLRFPDFKCADEWQPELLSKLARPVADRAIPGEDVIALTLSGEHGLVRQSEYFGKQIGRENADRYIKVRRNDLVYNDRTTKQSIYGSIKRLTQYETGIVSPIYKCFRFSADQNPSFWEWYFESGSHEEQLFGLINEGARAGRFNISIDRLLSTSVLLPNSQEQDRIAECLSSANELIAAEVQKLKALKVHNRELMQQLFPAEGETLPRVRFKEFQGVRAWRNDPIGETFETTSGGTPDRSKKEYWGGSGDIPWISTGLVNFNHIKKAQEFVTREGLKNSSAKVFPPGTILIAMYGQGRTRGQVAILDIAATTNQACAAILPKEGIDPEFVFLILSSRYEDLRALSNSGGQENLSQTLIRGFSVSIPWDMEEQLKIKSCLSCLNELIAEQTHRIKVLVQHKDGLMQQLFPAMDKASS